MYTHVRHIGTEVEFVEEVALLGVVDEGVLVVGAEGEAVVVGLPEFTTHETILGEVA